MNPNSNVGAWPPPVEYSEAREHIAATIDNLDNWPAHHRRAIERARQEYPGRADELRRRFRLLDLGRKMESRYRRAGR